MGKPKEIKEWSALTSFQEEMGEAHFEQKFIGGEQKFEAMMVSHWL